MNVYKLVWERLGRGTVPEGYEMTVDGRNADELAEQIHRFAQRKLTSRWFAVSVHEDGTFSVEAGRFGRGTWELLGTVAT